MHRIIGNDCACKIASYNKVFTATGALWYNASPEIYLPEGIIDANFSSKQALLPEICAKKYSLEKCPQNDFGT